MMAWPSLPEIVAEYRPAARRVRWIRRGVVTAGFVAALAASWAPLSTPAALIVAVLAAGGATGVVNRALMPKWSERWTRYKIGVSEPYDAMAHLRHLQELVAERGADRESERILRILNALGDSSAYGPLVCLLNAREDLD